MSDETNPTGAVETPTTGIATETATAVAEAPAEEKADRVLQTVEMTDIGPCKKHIKVTIDRRTVNERLDAKFTELVKDSVVPGFRPGKAPRKVIEKQFRSSIADQIKSQILMASLQQLAEENDVAPLAPPNINPNSIELPKDGPMMYEFDVEVRPEFELPNYKGLTLKIPQHTFTDEEIAQTERRVLSEYGQLVPKEGTVAIDDYITVDMTVRQGERLLGERKELQLRVDKKLSFKDSMAEQFAEQVQGAQAGDTRVVELTMSNNVADPELRGQKAEATLKIHDIKTMRLPELTPEFLGQSDVRTPEQLREQVIVLLQRRLEYEQKRSVRMQITEQIAASATWQLPQDLLMRQARNAMQRRVMEMRDSGMSEDDIKARQRMLSQDMLHSTELSLKEHFVLQKIAEIEKIDVSEADIEAEIEVLAEQNNESPRRARARMEKEDMLQALAAQMIERKVLELIWSSATFEDEKLTAPKEESLAMSDEQAVPGEMNDPSTATPPAPQMQ